MLLAMTIDVVRRMGVVASDDPVSGRMVVLDGLRAPDGTPRVSVLGALIDSIAGVHAFEVATDSVPLTADLAVHVVGGPVEPGRLLVASSELLKRRRTGAVFHVEVRDEADPDHLVAVGSVTYALATMVNGYAPEPYLGEWPPTDLCSSVDELLPIDDDARDVFDVPADERTNNSVHVLSGGAILLAADLAAARTSARVLGRPTTVTDLVVHFLTPGRVGPVRCTTQVLGTTPGHVSLRTVLTDTGADDRLVAAATATAVPLASDPADPEEPA